MKKIIGVVVLLLTMNIAHGAIVFVDQDASGTGDGSSWTNASTDLNLTLILANAGDTIWVAQGTYFAVLDESPRTFAMKNEVIIYGGFIGIETQLSERDWETNETILDGGDNVGVVFASGLDNSAVLDGFTVRNGGNMTSSSGGGITNISSSPTYRNLIITNNVASTTGGGISNLSGSAPVLTNVTITNNSAVQGGGMANSNSSPILTNVVISNNSSVQGPSSTQIGRGGGIYNFANNGNTSSPILTNVTITENTSTDLGGGIYNVGASPKLIDVVISKNEAKSGGGTYSELSSDTLMNVEISENIATEFGGGIFQNSSSIELTNVLINDNISGDLAGFSNSGAGLSTSSNVVTEFRNVTMVGNVNSSGVPSAVRWTSGFAMSVNNSIVLGALDWALTSSSSNNILTGTEADIFTDPANGDYTLKAGSEAIGAGDNSLVTTTTDIVGNIRIQEGVVDVGAYEFDLDLTRYYVDIDATGFEDGSSWTYAYTDIQMAIDRANAGDTIWVAEGRYVTDGESFSMKEDVEIYGGFTGVETMQVERDWSANETILDGNDENSVIINDNNGLTNLAILDGFTITNGNAEEGGGIMNAMSSPTLSNLKIQMNTAVDGGGIYNSASSPMIANVLISGNVATDEGGGIHERFSSASILNDVKVIENTASDDGGGIYIRQSNSILKNVIIKDNIAGRGEGVLNLQSSPELTNVLISGDPTADNDEGFFSLLTSVPVFRNVTIVNFDKAIDVSSTSVPIVYNSIVLGEIDGTIDSNSSNNIIEGVPADVFTDPANGDYTLKVGSVAIDAGDNSFVTVVTDIVGEARIQNSVVDAGAYEFEPDLTRYFVDVDATGFEDGSSWTNAYTDIQAAIDRSNTGDTIWVAEGRYVTDGESFSMKEDVEIYGGFTGVETMQEERDWSANETILDGNDENSVIANNNNGLTSAVVLDGFTITNGNASNGGGIYNDFGSSPTLTNLTISGNTARLGGGIYNDQSSPTLTNVTISENTADRDGGGIYSQFGSSPTLTNVTIVGNNADQEGDGIFNDSSSPILYNTIVLDNITNGSTSSSISSNSSNNILAGVPADIFTDPANGDYTLKAGSVAIDAGDNSFVNVATDIVGNIRVQNGMVDAGAYEFDLDLTRYYVDIDATGFEDGSSWTNAYTDIQAAIDRANAGDTIWVAEGRYVTDGESFSMKEDVEIYGGFTGVETMQAERDWSVNETILDGNDENSVIRNDNNGLTNLAVLDGFTITNGNATGEGGGIYNRESSPVLTNLKIVDNYAFSSGGGIANISSSLVIKDVLISGNSVIELWGGGIYEFSSSSLVTNTVIANNTSSSSAGGVAILGNSSSKYTNVRITDNTARNDGGFILQENDNDTPLVELTNVTFSGNISSAGSPSLGSLDKPILDVYNSIILSDISSLLSISSNSSNNILTGTPEDIFTDPANGDYTLKAGSVAVDVGENSFVTVVTDIEGGSRIQSGIVDAGAYESIGSCTVTSGPESTIGTHVGSLSYMDNGWTYYCTTDGAQLLGLQLDIGLTVNPSDVILEIGAGATYFQDNVGFINNRDGSAIMNRRWNVNTTGSSNGNSGVRLFNLPGDLDSLNATLEAVPVLPALSLDQAEYFKINGLAFDEPIANLEPSDIELVTLGASPGLNTYVQGTIGTSDFIEYQVSSFSGGGFGIGSGGTVLPLGDAASPSFYAENSISYRVCPTVVTTGDLTLAFNKPIEESVDVHIYNTLGGLVQVQTISINTTEEIIPVGNLSSGMYWIQIDGYATSTPSFVVQ